RTPPGQPRGGDDHVGRRSFVDEAAGARQLEAADGSLVQPDTEHPRKGGFGLLLVNENLIEGGRHRLSIHRSSSRPKRSVLKRRIPRFGTPPPEPVRARESPGLPARPCHRASAGTSQPPAPREPACRLRTG